MTMAPLDDIFEVLEIANELDEKGDQRIEAATKVRCDTVVAIPFHSRTM